jgi:hypothetical protein
MLYNGQMGHTIMVWVLNVLSYIDAMALSLSNTRRRSSFVRRTVAVSESPILELVLLKPE